LGSYATREVNEISFPSNGITLWDYEYISPARSRNYIDVHLTGLYPRAKAILRGNITADILEVDGYISGANVRDPLNKKYGVLYLEGTSSNSLKDIWVSGINLVVLHKYPGNRAAQHYIKAVNGGIVGVEHSDQIADNATVYLEGGRGMSEFCFISFSHSYHDLFDDFNKLKVSGECMLNFYHNDRDYYLSDQTLYLNDLEIEAGGLLHIFRWGNGRARLLVRKTSAHLSESLKRLVFEGYSAKKAGLRHYSSDYWEIGPGFPEPATYGAVFGTVGLGLALWRKRRRLNTSLVVLKLHE